MIRVADYIVERLAEYGIGHVFIVTGGTAMHLNACLWKSIRNQEGFLLPWAVLRNGRGVVFQGSNRIAAVNVTTGPGGTNAITGV